MTACYLINFSRKTNIVKKCLHNDYVNYFIKNKLKGSTYHTRPHTYLLRKRWRGGGKMTNEIIKTVITVIITVLNILLIWL